MKSKVARFRWGHIKLRKEQTQVLIAHRRKTATYRSPEDKVKRTNQSRNSGKGFNESSSATLPLSLLPNFESWGESISLKSMGKIF